jgi:hypothetical protein
MPKCTDEDHRALKSTPSLWRMLACIGVQRLVADGSEPERVLELRNCSCGSTLAVDITDRK